MKTIVRITENTTLDVSDVIRCEYREQSRTLYRPKRQVSYWELKLTYPMQDINGRRSDYYELYNFDNEEECKSAFERVTNVICHEKVTPCEELTYNIIEDIVNGSKDKSDRLAAVSKAMFYVLTKCYDDSEEALSEMNVMLSTIKEDVEKHYGKD